MRNTNTFNVLDFHPHAHVEGGVQAKLDLGDGFEISVVSMKEGERPFGGLYGNASAGTYEVAVFYNGNMTPLAKYDDVIGWQDEDAVTLLMRDIQNNGVAWLKLLQEVRDEYRAELLAD